MKTFKVKNYKGNLVESLKNFKAGNPNLRIVEAVEGDDGLKITAEEGEWWRKKSSGSGSSGGGSPAQEIWDEVHELCLKTKDALAVFEQIVDMSVQAMELEGDPHSYANSNTWADIRAQKKALDAMRAAFGDLMAY